MTRTLNVGIVTTWFERGAAYVSRQYRQVLETEHQVYIYARGGEAYAIDNPSWDDNHVTWGKKVDIPNPTAIDLQEFYRWLKDYEIDLVFFNEQHWWEPIFLCSELGITTGGYIDYYTEDTVPLFAHYDFLICNTKRHYSVFAWHPQCFYIPWGTDIGLFRPQCYESAKEGMVTFFHSCGFSPRRKGTDYVLESFYRAHADNAKLVVHTQRNLTEALPNLHDITYELMNNGTLEIIEKTEGAPGFYHLGDVYLYPSRLDGIGLTIAEALASGLPVIASDNAPMNEFIEQGVNGRLVSVNTFVSRSDGYYWPQSFIDVDDLAAHIRWYLEHWADLRTFKKSARDYAVNHLDWQKNAREIPGIFRQVARVRATGKPIINPPDISTHSQDATEPTTLCPISEWNVLIADERFMSLEDKEAFERHLRQTRADVVWVPVVYPFIENHAVARWEVAARKQNSTGEREENLFLKVTRGPEASIPYADALELFYEQRYEGALQRFVSYYQEVDSLLEKAVYIRWIILCLIELGRDDQALAVLSDALQVHEDNADLHYLNLLVSLLNGESEHTEAIANRAIALGEALSYPEFFIDIRSKVLELVCNCDKKVKVVGWKIV